MAIVEHETDRITPHRLDPLDCDTTLPDDQQAFSGRMPGYLGRR
jgi:hypothetical protein